MFLLSHVKKNIFLRRKSFFKTALQTWNCCSLTMSSSWNSEEIKIPVPYGSIAAKAWGNKNDSPVLAIHGWQDNAGTFDRLIPLFQSPLFIVAFDGAGQGRSSHKPPGTFYNFNDEFVDIKRIISFFGWKKFSIIGHSLGGAMALLYGSLYPEMVTNIILLDMLKPFSADNHKLPSITKGTVDALFELESKLSNGSPVYTYGEAKRRLMEGTYNEVTPESADILLIRGSRQSDCKKGVVFSRDLRIRYSDYSGKFSHEMLEAYLKNLSCNLLILRCVNSIMKTSNPEVTNKMFKIYEENCKTFMLIELNENHFVHLNKPEVVAPYINTFFKTHLQNTESKL